MTKPSEMSNVEAWDAAVHMVLGLLRGVRTFKPALEFLERSDLRFPPEPVERVSDLCLQNWAASQAIGDAYHMPLELIDRRAKDKQVERSDPTIVYDEEELTPGPKERKS